MAPRRILTVNAGSSSLRVAVFDAADTETRLAGAHIERIARGGHRTALERMLRDAGPFAGPFDTISHRIVHGGLHHTAPERLTAALRSKLDALVDIAPDHLPPALDAIDAATAAFPDVPQVACFDTAFHQHLPRTAAMLPLPRRYWDAGLRRFGFHGLSCEYVMDALRGLDPRAAGGSVIIAHLGNGASMTAVRDGRSVDTTMGFSPTGGLMMGTRSGDLDPGAIVHIMSHSRDRMNPANLNTLLTHEAGLLGVSGRSGDMRDLLAAEPDDEHAAEAIALFCHLARKALGGLIAVLGGAGALVFTGGIGEHAPPIRQRICEGLEPLGLEIDGERNRATAEIISTTTSRTTVRVIATDEDRMLARHARVLLTEGMPHV